MAETAASRGREVRRRLVQAARELVPERGWAGVSTRTVAERACVAPGLVHYHFASLQALLAEAAVGALRDMIGGVGTLLQQASTPNELVDLLIAEVDQYTGRDPASLLAVETYLAATRHPDLRQQLTAVLDEFRRLLAARLHEQGVPDPDATAAVLAAVVDGVLLHRALTPLPAGAVAPVLHRIVGKGEQR
jgi:AcrR family transcriptional regulator